MQREAGERYAWVVMACFDDHPSNRNELCEMYGLDEKSSFGSVEAAVEALHEALGRYRLGVKPAGLRGYYGQVFKQKPLADWQASDDAYLCDPAQSVQPVLYAWY